MLHLGIGDSVPIRTCSCTFLPRLARLQVSGKRCCCAASAKSAKALPKGRKKERKKAWLNLALNNYIPSIFITLILFSAVPSLSFAFLFCSHHLLVNASSSFFAEPHDYSSTCLTGLLLVLHLFFLPLFFIFLSPQGHQEPGPKKAKTRIGELGLFGNGRPRAARRAGQDADGRGCCAVHDDTFSARPCAPLLSALGRPRLHCCRVHSQTATGRRAQRRNVAAIPESKARWKAANK